MTIRGSFAATLAAALLACSSQGGRDAASGAPAPGDTTPSGPAAGPSASTDPPPAACSGIAETCTAYDTRSFCVMGPTGREWKSEKCAAGCFAGKCSTTACADECALGDVSGTETCRLWDMKSKAAIDADPDASLHDRARDYERLLRAMSLPHGQVLNVHFTDATLATKSWYSGYRDAAIWTGSALAAEAWRLAATREPDAARRVDALVQTLHRSFAVTGSPGYLARFVMPSSAPLPLGIADRCADPEWHCNVPWNGQSFDWSGGTSRDQNTGVMLGYALAYLATTDEAVKKTIREDVVAVVRELMKVRKAVPARIVINGFPLDKPLDLENVILIPSEMTNGRISINASTSEPSESEIAGMREFFPDFSMLSKQVLGLNVPVPRPGSALMLGGFFRMALRMTEDDPALASTHDAIAAYYAQHAPSWLSVADGWRFETRDGCGRGYFSTHIAYIMAYVWALLENDPPHTTHVRDKLFDQTLYKAVSGHKNPYFTFLWAGTRATGLSPTNPDVHAAALQLAQFQRGPRVHAARDTRAKPAYIPHDTKCTGEVLCNIQTNAVDVGDRRVDDFIWQRQPWQLYDAGDATKVYPGVDYLAAYWAGRRHQLLAEDRAGTCARFLP